MSLPPRVSRPPVLPGRAPASADPSASATPGETTDSTAQLARIAAASVEFAALGPQLAGLAADIERQAQAQAARAGTIALAMTSLTQALDKAIAELRGSSGQLHGALQTVERIADHTRLLSVNASIEAARAGEAGRAFAVVVDEVKRLADTSGQSTRLIEDRMREIDGSISRVAAVTVADEAAAGTAGATTPTVAAMDRDVRGLAENAADQLGAAKSVHVMGDRINVLTESLLLAVGRFRFEVHARAQEAVAALVPELAAAIGDRERLERGLARWLEAHPYFELGYITDARGRQIVDNLGRRDGAIVHDPAGYGRDWSSRPWYREARQHRSIASTDVYRSSATGDFCFSISAALLDPQGELVGVFGSDVSFQRLLLQ